MYIGPWQEFALAKLIAQEKARLREAQREALQTQDVDTPLSSHTAGRRFSRAESVSSKNSLRLPALPGSPAASTPLSSTSKSDSHTVIIRRSLSSESHKNERKTSQFPPISRKAIPSPQPIQHRRSISDKVAQRRPSKVSSHATASPAVSSKRPAAAAPAAKDVSNVMRQRAEHLAKMKTVYGIAGGRAAEHSEQQHDSASVNSTSTVTSVSVNPPHRVHPSQSPSRPLSTTARDLQPVTVPALSHTPPLTQPAFYDTAPYASTSTNGFMPPYAAASPPVPWHVGYSSLPQPYVYTPYPYGMQYTPYAQAYTHPYMLSHEQSMLQAQSLMMNSGYGGYSYMQPVYQQQPQLQPMMDYVLSPDESYLPKLYADAVDNVTAAQTQQPHVEAGAVDHHRTLSRDGAAGSTDHGNPVNQNQLDTTMTAEVTVPVNNVPDVPYRVALRSPRS